MRPPILHDGLGAKRAAATSSAIVSEGALAMGRFPMSGRERRLSFTFSSNSFLSCRMLSSWARTIGRSLLVFHRSTRRSSSSRSASSSSSITNPAGTRPVLSHHCFRCWMSSSCLLWNFRTRGALPRLAMRNPYPSSESFFTTFSTAEFADATTPTVFPWAIREAIRLRIVCVFPVPGGPSIIEI